MPKKKAESAVIEVIAPASISLADAKRLDAQINTKIKEATDSLALAYIEVGGYLKEMRDSNGFTHLGFERWENYLDSKKEFGRTYLSYLYKIGQAGDLKGLLGKGMSGTKLIEFAKRTDFPEKIPQLIKETWATVKDKPIRETAILLNEYVREHEDTYRRPKAKKGGRPKLGYRAKLDREFERLTEAEQAKFLKAVRAFVEDHREARKAKDD